MDLTLDQALFEGADRLEDVVESVGVGGDEGTAAGDLGQAFQQGDVRSFDLGDDGQVGARIGAVHDAAGTADGDRVQCHAQVSRQGRRLLRIERMRDRRVVVAVGQEHEHLLARGRLSKGLEDQVIASPMFVPSSPGRAARIASAGSTRKRWSSVGGQASRGSWRRQEADQVIGPAFDEPDECVLGRFQPADFACLRSAGKSGVFMLELWSSATTIATPCPRPGSRRRPSAAAPAPPPVPRSPGRGAEPASDERAAGPIAASRIGGKAGQAGPEDPGPGPIEHQRQGNQHQEQEPAGLGKRHGLRTHLGDLNPARPSARRGLGPGRSRGRDRARSGGPSSGPGRGFACRRGEA